MFLFTTPPASSVPPAPPASPVVEAIRLGAERTGTGFDYLLATAKRESALNPAARARTSSATGLFQFIEQTWLGVLKSEGPKHGLGEVSAAIVTRSDGTHTVEDPALRSRVLALREDPKVASVVAGAFTQQNRSLLAADLGREPTGADLYIAHFLGPRGALELIRNAQRSPQSPAAASFPEAAGANRSIFYDRAGRARGAGEVYALLAAHHGSTDTANAVTASSAVPTVKTDRPGLYGLFQTEGHRGPVSERVARIWRTEPAGGVRTAALSYFPRSTAEDGVAAAPVALAPPVTEAGKAPLAEAPLPPPRPDFEGARPARRTKAGAPLDLAAFRKARP